MSRILNSEAWSNYPENVKAKAGGLILRRLWDEMVEKEKAKEKREIEECLSLFEQERGKVREQQEKEKERDAEREKNQILDRQKRLEEELRRCQRDYVQRYGDRGRARDIGFVLGDEYPASSPGRETFHGPPTPTGHPSGFMFGSGPGDEIRSPISRSESPRLPPLSIAGELQLMRVTNGTSTASSISAGMQTPPSRGVTLRDS